MSEGVTISLNKYDNFKKMENSFMKKVTIDYYYGNNTSYYMNENECNEVIMKQLNSINERSKKLILREKKINEKEEELRIRENSLKKEKGRFMFLKS